MDIFVLIVDELLHYDYKFCGDNRSEQILM